MALDGTKTGVREKLPGQLFAPCRPEPEATLRQRYSHAMHARDRIDKGAERMVAILSDIA